jgi:hypothetical protein
LDAKWLTTFHDCVLPIMTWQILYKQTRFDVRKFMQFNMYVHFWITVNPRNRLWDAPTIPHWARVVSSGPFSLCVIHKEGLGLSSGDISGLISGMGLSDYSSSSYPYPTECVFHHVAIKIRQLVLRPAT